jgi:hypothetical protein
VAWRFGSRHPQAIMNPKPGYQIFTHATAIEPLRWDGHMSDGVGATYGPTPLAFLSATPDEILLCGNRGSFRLPRGDIRRISRSGLYPWFFSAVRIHHQLASAPDRLEFKPMGATARDVLTRLQGLGLPVG